MSWRIYYDRFRHPVRYDYLLGGVPHDYRDWTAGDWVGSQLTYDFTISHVGVLTVGSELNADIRALQQVYEAAPQRLTTLSLDRRDIAYGLFAQQRWEITSAWTAYFGARFDDSHLHADFVSPRAALVFRASEETTYKLIYGWAFRNPNAYESYYDDGQMEIGNASLRPERAETFELDVDHKFGKRWNGVLNAYHYRLNNLIEAVTTPAGLLQYQNTDRGSADGVGAELSGKPRDWLETAASVALQHPELDNYAQVVNAPVCVAKWRAATALLRRKLWAAGAMQYLSPRQTAGGATVRSVWVTDLTFTTRKLHPDFDIQFGVRNALNRTYYDPAGTGLPEQMLRQDGRSVFLKLILRTRE